MSMVIKIILVVLVAAFFHPEIGAAIYNLEPTKVLAGLILLAAFFAVQ